MELTEEQIKAIAGAAAKDAVEQYRKSEPAEHKAGVNISVGEEKVYKSLGEQLIDVYKAATVKGFDTTRLNQTEERGRKALGMNELAPADGGFLVQTEESNTLIQKTYETGVLASRVTKQPIGAGKNSFRAPMLDEVSRADGSRRGGILAYWMNEAGTKLPSHPTFSKWELSLQKLTGLVYVTDELLEDAVALEAWIRREFPLEFGFLLDAAIYSGNGVGKPLGMLTCPAAVSVAKEVGQKADTIVTQNINRMWSRMPLRNRMNSVWLINQEDETQLDQLSMVIGTGGVPVYLPPGGLSEKPFASLKGRPVLPIEQAEALGDKGDIMLVDLSEYMLIDKGAIQTASSIHVAFATDETAFRFVYRVNGAPIPSSPLTPYKGASTLSPFVTLDERA